MKFFKFPYFGNTCSLAAMTMNRYTLNTLKEKFDKDEKIQFLFFWGHKNETQEKVGKFIFSQWYPSPFLVDNVKYKTAEHWMMASKAKLFNDNEALERILINDSPKAAKSIGREVKGFDAEIWKTNCFSIVVEGNKQKFLQNPGFQEYLISTENKIIVEASPVDTIWGVGMAQDNRNIYNPYLWRGQNLLEFALMEVRDILIK